MLPKTLRPYLILLAFCIVVGTAITVAIAYFFGDVGPVIPAAVSGAVCGGFGAWLFVRTGKKEYAAAEAAKAEAADES